MSTGINVKVDLTNIEKKLSPQAIKRGRIALSNQILIDSEPFVPLGSTGALRASGHGNPDGSKVIWNTVYARAHFYGTNGIVTFRFYSTPGTGPDWTETAEYVNSNKWERVVMKGMGIK